LNLPDLYNPEGQYRYTGGFSLIALFVLVVSILPNLPGFLVEIKKWPNAWATPDFFVSLYRYSWFVGFGLAFGLYLPLRSLFPRK
jgi:nucleobase:cation symporter-1, NCS1 family